MMEKHLPGVLFVVIILLVIYGGISSGGSLAFATLEYSCETGESCRYCHEDPYGGGSLTTKGEAYRDAGYSFQKAAAPPVWYAPLRLLIGFLHILAAVVWFGAIFYIHLFVKPGSLTSGLPRSDRILGWSCIGIVGLSGIILTLYRIRAWNQFWTTTFGLVWMVKVALFAGMLGIAAVATTHLNRRMRENRAEPDHGGLSGADGKEGRPARFSFAGRIYDVSESKLWRQGVHMGRHHAGEDLSEAMAGAPHSVEVLAKVKDLGEARGVSAGQSRPAVKAIVFLAYFILFLMLAILFCVAYWNWGPPITRPRF